MPAAASATAPAMAAPRRSASPARRAGPAPPACRARAARRRPPPTIGAGDSKPTSSSAGSCTARSSTGASEIHPARCSAACAAASGMSARPTAPAAPAASQVARAPAPAHSRIAACARERERREVVGQRARAPTRRPSGQSRRGVGSFSARAKQPQRDGRQQHEQRVGARLLRVPDQQRVHGDERGRRHAGALARPAPARPGRRTGSPRCRRARAAAAGPPRRCRRPAPRATRGRRTAAAWPRTPATRVPMRSKRSSRMRIAVVASSSQKPFASSVANRTQRPERGQRRDRARRHQPRLHDRHRHRRALGELLGVLAGADVLAPVHRHRHRGLDPPRRLGRLARGHHVGPAHRQQRDVHPHDLVHLGDHVGVAGVVEPLAAHVELEAHASPPRAGGRGGPRSSRLEVL